MARERNKPQGTTLERIDKDYEKLIHQRYKDFKDGYNKAIEKACNVFCHTGCPHKTDSFDCLNNKCDT